MRNMKKWIASLFLATVFMSVVTGCGKDDGIKVDKSAITIVYTNDVHSYIDNVVTDEEGNILGNGFRFSKIAAMVEDMKADGGNVLLVDAGDEIQGDIYGAMDEGETIINLMKATGYQLATPGNHDFDYGVMQLLKLAENAGFPYVTCNFHATDGSETTFSNSSIFDIGGKKVAFVGVTTPETMLSSTPVYFQDEKGEFIYTIDGLSDANDLYASVQNAVDEVKDQVDYVIGIGHLGVGIDETKKGWDSKSVIAKLFKKLFIPFYCCITIFLSSCTKVVTYSNISKIYLRSSLMGLSI